jgi:hypothetical protein
VVTPLHRLAPYSYATPSVLSHVAGGPARGHLHRPHAPTSQAVAAPPHTARGATSVQDLRQPSDSSSPTSTTAAAPPHVTCTASAAAASFAASTFVLVQYDFAASVIASSSTSLLLQPPMASAPLRRSASRNRSGALSASPSTYREVHTGPALRMLGAGKTAACLRPRCVPVPGKLGSVPRLHRPRQCLLWHRLL